MALLDPINVTLPIEQEDVIDLVDNLASKANVSALTAHASAVNNPHATDAAQVGAYSTNEVDGLLNAKANKLTEDFSSTNFAEVDSNGQYQRSGYTSSSFASSTHAHSASDISDFSSAVSSKANTVGEDFSGPRFAEVDGSGQYQRSGYTSSSFATPSDLEPKANRISTFETQGQFLRLASDGGFEASGFNDNSFANSGHSHGLADLSSLTATTALTLVDFQTLTLDPVSGKITAPEFNGQIGNGDNRQALYGDIADFNTLAAGTVSAVLFSTNGQQGLSTSFATGDSRTATFSGGILIGLV